MTLKNVLELIQLEVLEKTLSHSAPDVIQAEEVNVPEQIIELPEHIQIIETEESGIPQKTVIKKRTLKKIKGNKAEVTEICSIEKEGEKPETTVEIKEVELPYLKLSRQIHQLSLSKKNLR